MKKKTCIILIFILFWPAHSIMSSYAFLFKQKKVNQSVPLSLSEDVKRDTLNKAADWKISASVVGDKIYSEITSCMDSLMFLRLESHRSPGAGSFINVYIFDGAEWKYYRTGNIFMQDGALRTPFTPGETKSFFVA